MDPICTLRSCRFDHASNLWEGETLEPKVAPSNREMGDEYRGSAPCPIVIDVEGARETTELMKYRAKQIKLLTCGRACSALGRRAGTQDYIRGGCGTLQDD